jgi:hypothetical protein
VKSTSNRGHAEYEEMAAARSGDKTPDLLELLMVVVPYCELEQGHIDFVAVHSECIEMAGNTEVAK